MVFPCYFNAFCISVTFDAGYTISVIVKAYSHCFTVYSSEILLRRTIFYLEKQLHLSTTFRTVVSLLLVLDIRLQTHRDYLYPNGFQFQHFIPVVKN